MQRRKVATRKGMPSATQVAKEMAKMAIKQQIIPRGTAKRAGGFVGKRVGQAVAGKAGTQIGRYVGRRLGATFAKITGVGDYQIDAEGSIMPGATAYAPQMRSTAKDIIIERSEYIGDLYSGTGTPSVFTAATLAVNAGLGVDEGGVFTWLPQVAAGFQQWQLESMVLEYRPTSGNATGANTALGSVIIAADYNPANPQTYVEKSDLLNSQWAISGSPDKCILFPVECAPRDEPIKWHDIRTGPAKSTENLNLTDLCNIIVATVGCQTASQNLGELHVVYKMRLSKFKTNKQDQIIASAHYGIGTYTNGSTPLGTLTTWAVTYNNNNLPLTLVKSGSLVAYIAFPASLLGSNNTYMMVISWKGASTASCAVGNVISGTSGVAAVNAMYAKAAGGATVQSAFTSGTNAQTSFHSVVFFKITGTTDGSAGAGLPYLDFTGSFTLPASGTDVDVIITQVNGPAMVAP